MSDQISQVRSLNFPNSTDSGKRFIPADIDHSLSQLLLPFNPLAILNSYISLFPSVLLTTSTQDDYMESLQNFYSPLENTLMLGELLVIN